VFRNRERMVKIVVWVVVFTMVLAILASIVPALT
jgi:ABC-type lipoprotein release transport system permease subunit